MCNKGVLNPIFKLIFFYMNYAPINLFISISINIIFQSTDYIISPLWWYNTIINRNNRNVNIQRLGAYGLILLAANQYHQFFNTRKELFLFQVLTFGLDKIDIFSLVMYTKALWKDLYNYPPPINALYTSDIFVFHS